MLRGCKNNKKIHNIIMASIVLAVILSSLLMPFSIYGDQSLPSPFVGFNVNYIDVDVDDEYETNISGTSGTYTGTNAKHTASVSLTGDFTGIERTSSGVTYITTETSVGSVNGVNTQTGTITEAASAESGTITLNLSSSNTIHINENGIFEIEIILDNYYVGYFNMSLKYGSVTYLTKTIYVNGNSCKFTYTELGSIGSNTTLNNYTISINSFNLSSSLYKNWSFPVESYSIIYSAFNNNLSQVGIDKYNDYLFPIFQVNQNDIINGTRFNNGQSFYFIFMLDKTINTIAALQNYFDFGDLTIDGILLLNRFLLGNQYVSLVRVQLTNNTGNAQNFLYTYIYANSSKYMPIFNGVTSYKYISTDFALQFGLTNDLLDNLGIIANGTNASNNSSNNLNNQNSQFASDSQQLMNIESNYNQDLNNQLQNIDFTNPINNNPNFLSSASFVVTIFNTLIANNPLTIFILIICIILVGKRLFGK